MNVLVIAPHADDEAIGLGGTIAKHANSGDEVTLAVLTGQGPTEHPVFPSSSWDTVRAECRKAAEVLKIGKVVFEELPAVLVGEQPSYIVNEVTKQIVDTVEPDVIYVPFPFDLHRDHRVLFDSMCVAWRPTSSAGKKVLSIYCYETQSETHWNIPYVEAGFLPNHFVDITDTVELKQQALACYTSQIRPAPDARSIKAIMALATWRGSLIGVESAEAFVTVRTVA